jgi:hypothetical protein
MLINGVEYVKKTEQEKLTKKVNGLEHVIVRTHSAGVFAGYLKSRKGQECVLLNARRLWSWKGAASLSQLAMEGVKFPEECRFPREVAEITLLQAIEIIPTTQPAKDSIDGVPVWSA